MPVRENIEPHYSVICDECGEAIGSEDYGGWILFTSRDDALSEANDWKWKVSDDGVVTCESCQEEAEQS